MSTSDQAIRTGKLIPNRVEIVDLPVGDYVAPGFWVIQPDEAFLHMRIGDPSDTAWPYLRRDVSHNWYVDDRAPSVGFVNRDEASILYNSARLFVGRRCLEIGCWRGWSTAHIAAGSGALDVVDPVLGQPEWRADVENSLRRAGVLDRTKLYALPSPEGLEELISEDKRPWSFIFIDGDHEGDAPRRDAEAVIAHAADDALILLHDLLAPAPAKALSYLRAQGWRTLVYQTSQIMAVAWRGDVAPVPHTPDAAQIWRLPEHLRSFEVSGENFGTRAERFADVIAKASAEPPAGGREESTVPAAVGERSCDDGAEALAIGEPALQKAWSTFLDHSEDLQRQKAASEAALVTAQASLEAKIKASEGEQAAWRLTFNDVQDSLRTAYQDAGQARGELTATTESLRRAQEVVEETRRLEADARAELQAAKSETDRNNAHHIAELQEARRAEEGTRAELGALWAERDQALGAAREDAKQAAAELTATTERLDKAREDLEETRRNEADARAQLAAAKTEADLSEVRHRAELQDARQAEESARAELAELQAERDRIASESREHKDRLWELESRIAQQAAEHDDQETERTRLLGAIAQMEARVDELNNELQKQDGDLNDRVNEMNELVTRTRSEATAVSQAWAKAEAERNALSTEVELARLQSERAREEANAASLEAAALRVERGRLESTSGEEKERLRASVESAGTEADRLRSLAETTQRDAKAEAERMMREFQALTLKHQTQQELLAQLKAERSVEENRFRALAQTAQREAEQLKARLEAEEERMTHDMQAIAFRYQAVVQSTSWRFTSPLRRLLTFLRQIPH